MLLIYKRRIILVKLIHNDKSIELISFARNSNTYLLISPLSVDGRRVGGNVLEQTKIRLKHDLIALIRYTINIIFVCLVDYLKKFHKKPTKWILSSIIYSI